MFGRSPRTRSPAAARAHLSLEGLSVGDAFGERFFGTESVVLSRIAARSLPAPPWFWTDDTAMALSVCRELEERGRIDSDALARRFASEFAAAPSVPAGIFE